MVSGSLWLDWLFVEVGYGMVENGVIFEIVVLFLF